jgi:hypothetical protein
MRGKIAYITAGRGGRIPAKGRRRKLKRALMETLIYSMKNK